MSTLNVANVTDGTTTVPTGYVVNGSAKAWVNFNGTGTIAARDSLNLSSLTDNGTGKYDVNFTNTMANGNYAACNGIRKRDATDDGNMVVVLGATSRSYSTSAVSLTTRFVSNEGLQDGELVCLSLNGDLA